MKYLFCITGYGGSGKDTFLKELQNLIHINTFPTYSDRPSRGKNENSSTHCISSDEFDKNISTGFFLEIRKYITNINPDNYGQHTIWRYATPDITKLMDDNSVAAMVTSFDQFCCIYDAAPHELCAIPIVINASKSLILYRSLMRLFESNNVNILCDDTDINKLNECDKMVQEVASRFLRDLDQQNELEKIPIALKYINNNIADLKHNVYDLGMAILKYNYMDTMGDINNTKFTTILEQLNEFMANREKN